MADEDEPVGRDEALARIRAVRDQLHPLGPHDPPLRRRMIEDVTVPEWP